MANTTTRWFKDFTTPKASLVSFLVHYASHMLICNRRQLFDLNTDRNNIYSIIIICCT